MSLKEITIKRHQLHLKILDKVYQELSDRELAFSFYQQQASSFISIHFITPTVFKQNGKYLNYPEIRCIYANLGVKCEYWDSYDEMNRIIIHQINGASQ